jgi:hypothetical protein
MASIQFVGKKTLKGRQQECAKSSSFFVRRLQKRFLQKLHKEALNTIRRVITSESSSASIRIERRPVSLAQCRQRRLNSGTFALTGSDHQAPLSRVKGCISIWHR